MINSKNISIDYVLNRKKNIMNILFNDINYKSTKIKYETPFVHKIKIIKTDKIKQLNFSRNVNNLKIKENNCVDTSDMNNIIIKDLQDIPISVILPDKNNLTDINGNEILIKKSDISKYDKDILFYNYEDKNEDEPDIDELTKIILQEIENMKNEIMWFSKMSDDFLKNKDTSIEYNKYKEMPANKNIDEKFENIIKHYDVMIEQNGL